MSRNVKQKIAQIAGKIFVQFFCKKHLTKNTTLWYNGNLARSVRARAAHNNYYISVIILKYKNKKADDILYYQLQENQKWGN